jgi:histidinol dehydrogenase
MGDHGQKHWFQEIRLPFDMPAGPSEVAVIADQWSNPAFIAADLLSQS